jgi:outer membrane immunogenic protein
MNKSASMVAIAFAALAASAAPAGADAWNGFYVGAHTGYGMGDVDQPYGNVGGPFTFTDQTAPDVDGWVYGLQGGVNWSAGGGWVFGGELQGTWGDREGDDNGTGGDVNGVDIKSEWSIRARGGYLMSPNFLLYGTVGYVSMDVDATAPIDGAVNESINGWTYGIGGEWAFNDRWSGVLEWRTDEMDETRFSFPSDGYDEGLTPNTSAIRVGVNWHPY